MSTFNRKLWAPDGVNGGVRMNELFDWRWSLVVLRRLFHDSKRTAQLSVVRFCGREGCWWLYRILGDLHTPLLMHYKPNRGQRYWRSSRDSIWHTITHVPAPAYASERWPSQPWVVTSNVLPRLRETMHLSQSTSHNKGDAREVEVQIMDHTYAVVETISKIVEHECINIIKRQWIVRAGHARIGL